MNLHRFAGWLFWIAVIAGFCFENAGWLFPEHADAFRHIGESCGSATLALGFLWLVSSPPRHTCRPPEPAESERENP